ncbi:AAA family ATPase [Mesorhizobium yinganensis]|uniref:AAA family ATPase n=1 Tax=Mesorhizobium yinganensis TaxID=3157707 RepID=UPI0032B847F4
MSDKSNPDRRVNVDQGHQSNSARSLNSSSTPRNDAETIISALGGRGSMCRCPAHKDDSPSLSVKQDGDRILVKCHAGCSQEAVIEALKAKGLWPTKPTTKPRPRRKHEDGDTAYEDAVRFREAFKILRAAAMANAGAPVEYLRHRGIDIVPVNAMLLPAKDARRLLGKGYPAMVLPVAKGGKLVGAHITLLDATATGKLATDNPRKLYGPIKGGHVQLGRLDPDRPLIVAEGIETTLAASQLADLPAVASLNASNMRVCDVPAASSVIICADNDESGTGQDAANALAQRLHDIGRPSVRIAIPDEVGQDWNDELLHSDADPDILWDAIRKAKRVKDRGIRAIRLDELVEMNFPPPEFLMKPWLAVGNIAMIHSARGSAKTWLGLSVSYAMAESKELLGWTAEKPRRVLFVDGEMGIAALQKRLSHMGLSKNLWVLTPDQFYNRQLSKPDIATKEGQEVLNKIIEAEGIEVIVLDNISTLVRTGVENEAESWMPLQEWALAQRQQGRAVVFVHHEGKGGKPRGSSKREDVLDVMVGLTERKDLVRGEESAFELTFTKTRHFAGEDARSRIVRLSMEDGGLATWTVEDSRGATEQKRAKVVELLHEGMKQKDIAEKLGLTAARVSQIVKEARKAGELEPEKAS